MFLLFAPWKTCLTNPSGHTSSSPQETGMNSSSARQGLFLGSVLPELSQPSSKPLQIQHIFQGVHKSLHPRFSPSGVFASHLFFPTSTLWVSRLATDCRKNCMYSANFYLTSWPHSCFSSFPPPSKQKSAPKMKRKNVSPFKKAWLQRHWLVQPGPETGAKLDLGGSLHRACYRNPNTVPSPATKTAPNQGGSLLPLPSKLHQI